MKKKTLLLITGMLVSQALFAGSSINTLAAEQNSSINALAAEQNSSTAEIAAAAEEPELFANTYSVSGNTITVTAKQNSDISEVLNEALLAARDMADAGNGIITINVPAGTYKQTDALHIFSNTTLNLKGVTLQASGSAPFNMLITGTMGTYKGQKPYNTSSLCSKYNGFKNITVNGGTFVSNSKNDSAIVRLFHATNVKLTGLTLKGGACSHQMEVCAIDGFYVTNCTFQDNGKKETDIDNHDNQEALQLDMPCRDFVFPDIYSDGTPMKNVEITGCTFKNVARGVGTHTLLKGAYHENIKINGNTFDNVLEECIIGLNYYNCEIKNNTITNCGGGIIFQNFKSTPNSMNTTILNGKKKYTGEFRYDMKTVISGNNITLRYTPTCADQEGIKVFGYKQTKSAKGGDGFAIPVGNYYISGVTVTNNTIVTSGHGIHLLDARNCTVTNNKITGKNFSKNDPDRNNKDGIFVENYSKNITITNNKISNMTMTGLLVQTSSTVGNITNNSFVNCGGRGIQIYNKSGCSGTISGNTIRKCKSGGILVSTGSTTGVISGNTISKCSGDAGITVYKNSKTGKITKNNITDMGKDAKKTLLPAVKVTTSSATGSITGNKIQAVSEKYSSSRAILIYNSSKVSGSITSNTLEKCNDTAISISLKSKVTGSVSNNKITSAARYGIQTLNSSTIGKTITGNTIKNAKTCGINICSTKNKLTIDKNKISGCSNAAIYVQPNNTKYKVTVKNNTLTGNKKGPGVAVIKGNIKITGNKITKVTYGVFADKSCKGNIYSNKITKASKKKVYTATKNVKLKK